MTSSAARSIVFVLLLCLYGVALADTGTAGIGAGSLWALLALVLCQAIAFCIRFFAPGQTFFHSNLGLVVISLSTGILGAIEPVIQARGIHAQALAWAAANAALAFFTSSNPSLTRNNMSKKKSENASPPILLPIILMSLLAGGATGCTRAFWACELGKIPIALESLIVDVSMIVASGGADWEAALDDLVKKNVPGQVECIALAIENDNAPATLKAVPDAAKARLRQWLAKHPPPAHGQACTTLIRA